MSGKIKGSYKWTRAVFEHSRSRGPARAIMLALAIRADDSGHCYPGMRRLAKDAGMTTTTVQRNIRKLAKSGEIIVHTRAQPVNTSSGKQWTNAYQINPDMLKGVLPEHTPEVCAGSRIGVCRESPEVCAEGRIGVLPEHTEEPSEEPLEEPIKNQAGGSFCERIEH